MVKRASNIAPFNPLNDLTPGYLWLRVDRTTSAEMSPEEWIRKVSDTGLKNCKVVSLVSRSNDQVGKYGTS